MANERIIEGGILIRKNGVIENNLSSGDLLNEAKDASTLPLQFSDDSGIVTVANFNIVSASNNTTQGYNLSVDGIPIAQILCEANGVGGIKNLRLVASSFQLSDAAGQVTTAINLGYPARVYETFSGNRDSTFVIPAGCTIRELLIEHSAGTGAIDGLAVEGLSIKSKITNSTILSAFNVVDKAYEFTPSQVLKPVLYAGGEVLVVNASSWHSNTLKIHVFYQNLL